MWKEIEGLKDRANLASYAIEIDSILTDVISLKENLSITELFQEIDAAH